MADRNALAALIEAVEAGSATAPKIHDALGRNALHAISAYNGFLDAAKVLHESLLPGWHWSVSHSRSGGGATVWHEPDKCRAAFTAANPSPARAFLLAILRARAGGEAAQG